MKLDLFSLYAEILKLKERVIELEKEHDKLKKRCEKLEMYRRVGF